MFTILGEKILILSNFDVSDGLYRFHSNDINTSLSNESIETLLFLFQFHSLV